MRDAHDVFGKEVFSKNVMAFYFPASIIKLQQKQMAFVEMK